MQARCSCGALLPEDARFCHKCGKPQYEEDIARLAAEETSPPARPAAAIAQDIAIISAAAAGISFKNSRAVLISLLTAGGAFFCCGIAALITPVLAPLVFIGAGFLAVVLYRGGSRQPLSAAAGARLGWMTGLWIFIVFVFLGTVVSVYVSSPAGADLIKNMPQFNNLPITNPHDLVVNCLVSAIPTFFISTLLPGLGGILGARLSRGRRSA